MPSFAISKFTVLLETLWVSSRIFAFVNRSVIVHYPEKVEKIIHFRNGHGHEDAK